MFAAGVGIGITKCARAQRDCDAAAIFGAGVKIARGFEASGDGGYRLGNRSCIKPRSDQMRHIEPQRTIADTTNTERDLDAAPLLINRDLRRGRHEGKIRLPCTDFMRS